MSSTVNCARTFSVLMAPAGQTFQITYAFTNNDMSNAVTITNFIDNSWLPSGILQIPSGGLNPMISGTGWAPSPTSSTGAGATFFALVSNTGTIAAGGTGNFTIDVEGVMLGTVLAFDFTDGFNTGNVTFTTSGNVVPTLQSDSDVTITAMICVAEGTLVALADGRQMPIELLREGHLLVDHAGRPTRLTAAIRVDAPTTSLIQLEQGSLGREVPSAPLLIRPGHPLLVAGKEVLPEALLDLPGVAQVQLEKPVHVYTLLTEQRSFVDMQGALVGTWSEAAWQNFVESDSRSAHLHWSTLE